MYIVQNKQWNFYSYSTVCFYNIQKLKEKLRDMIRLQKRSSQKKGQKKLVTPQVLSKKRFSDKFQLKRDLVGLGIQNTLNFQKKILNQSNEVDKKTQNDTTKQLILQILTAIHLLEFTLHLCILVLQQSSSKLSLKLFCILVGILIFLTLLVAFALFKMLKNTSTKNLKVVPRQFIQSLAIQNQVGPGTTTQPIIRQRKFVDENQKTKKLKKLVLQRPCEEQSANNLKKMPLNPDNQREDDYGYQVKQMIRLLAGSKITHVLFEFIYMSIFLGTIENPHDSGLSVEFILILVAYFICGASLFLLYHIQSTISSSINAESCSLKLKYPSKDVQQDKEPSKPQTALSIEQYMHQITQKLSENVSFGRIATPKSRSNPHSEILNIAPQENMSSQNGAHKQNSQFQPSSPKSPSSSYQNQKIQTKKSVLKQSKTIKPINITADNYLGYLEEEQSQSYERRKVAINSKKIEYFQYKASQNGSAADDEEQSVRCKSSFSKNNKCYQRNKYNKQKIKLETLAIERGQPYKQNKKRSKSETNRKSSFNNN